MSAAVLKDKIRRSIYGKDLLTFFNSDIICFYCYWSTGNATSQDEPERSKQGRVSQIHSFADSPTGLKEMAGEPY